MTTPDGGASVAAAPAGPPGHGAMPRWRAWVLAARLRTLPAAAAPVLVGTAAAAGAGLFRPLPALAALVGALLLQVGTNYANDVFDFLKGADGPDRVGPTRAVAAGLLQPREVLGAMAATFLASVAVGAYLVAVGGWPILAIGLAGIAAGILYTGGPWPLGYHGLGDLFVFVFFGPVAVGGTYYVQAGAPSAAVLWAGVALGLLATAILAVNNLRDIASDTRAGKRTLSVRFGRRASRVYYTALLLLAYVIVVLQARSFAALLPLATLPIAARLAGLVWTEEGPTLNRALAGTAQLLGLVSLLWIPAWL
jgi:1,4-dihydroxy-2-naphthoate polyprenyltransferase